MAGNSNSGKRAGGKDFAPRVRSILDRALAKVEAKGDAERLMLQALEDDFVGTLQRLACYAPKQIDANISGSLTLEDFVTGMVTGQVDDSTEESQLH